VLAVEKHTHRHRTLAIFLTIHREELERPRRRVDMHWSFQGMWGYCKLWLPYSKAATTVTTMMMGSKETAANLRRRQLKGNTQLTWAKLNN
jgi:hypothetical protein